MQADRQTDRQTDIFSGT
ncbi:hypothetical protein R3I93_022966 [Phoxinus phoxinus]|uniref:Uncharacterized protein n=1 Tax=Phoxinus phoxinus TaxID=58324 RepID=A0AAN9GR99_9TELE